MKKVLLTLLLLSSTSTFAIQIESKSDPVLPEVCGPTATDLDYEWNWFSQVNSENQKINKIARLLDNYFNRKKLAGQIENILYRSCNFLNTEKKYIKKAVFEKYQEYKGTYDNTVNSWYALVPLLDKKLKWENINKSAYNYHVRVFIDNIKKLVKLQKYLSNIHYAKIEYLTTSEVKGINNPDFDKNWKEYYFKNMLANWKQLNRFQLIYNKKLHSNFSPYKSFSLVYLGNLTKWFKVIALSN